MVANDGLFHALVDLLPAVGKQDPVMSLKVLDQGGRAGGQARPLGAACLLDLSLQFAGANRCNRGLVIQAL